MREKAQRLSLRAQGALGIISRSQFLSGEPFSVKILQAQAYWRGNKESTLPEVLIDGRIEVTEIVEEFGAR